MAAAAGWVRQSAGGADSAVLEKEEEAAEEELGWEVVGVAAVAEALGSASSEEAEAEG